MSDKNFLTCTGNRVCASTAYTAIALNRHEDDNDAVALAVGLGVGLGVGIPVALLLLFLCCVLPCILIPFLWYVPISLTLILSYPFYEAYTRSLS